jgi:xanthine dehydrogenase molybdopterin-binding subunit B
VCCKRCLSVVSSCNTLHKINVNSNNAVRGLRGGIVLNPKDIIDILDPRLCSAFLNIRKKSNYEKSHSSPVTGRT